jgi:hypothetical protein
MNQNALNDEAAKRFETAESKLIRLNSELEIHKSEIAE